MSVKDVFRSRCDFRTYNICDHFLRIAFLNKRQGNVGKVILILLPFCILCALMKIIDQISSPNFIWKTLLGYCLLISASVSLPALSLKNNCILIGSVAYAGFCIMLLTNIVNKIAGIQSAW